MTYTLVCIMKSFVLSATPESGLIPPSPFQKLAPLTRQSFILFLMLISTHVLALPATAGTPLTSLTQAAAPSLSASPIPAPGTAVCDQNLGWVNPNDCNAAISMLPRDPPGQSVARNFYTKDSDISHTMPNQRLPLERTSGNSLSANPVNAYIPRSANIPLGGCTAQYILATDFTGIPSDVSSYIDLIFPARNVLQECVRGRGTGGVIVQIGAGTMFIVSACHNR